MGTRLALAARNSSLESQPLDRRRVALQIRAILIPYRVERQRRDTATLEQFRLRARRMMDALEEGVEGDPELRKALADARREIDAGDA
jgi:hypothetical protein